MKNLMTVFVAVSVGAAMFMAGRGCSRTDGAGGAADGDAAAVRVDTLVIRDTVRQEVPVVKHALTIRVDTVFVKVAGDTVYIAAELPVERKVYLTDDYRAVVEGFRPSLASMEIYRQTRLVDRLRTVKTADRRRWGVELQAGWGFSSKGAVPYVGVGVGYRLVTW